jgi:hypothetical protein
VGLLGLAVWALDLSKLFIEFFKGFDRDPVGESVPFALGGLLACLLPVLLVCTIRLRFSAKNANQVEAGKDLRRMRRVGVALFSIAAIFTAGVYVVGGPGVTYVWAATGMAVCTLLGFLLLNIRGALERVVPSHAGPAAVPARGFSVIMPSGQADAQSLTNDTGIDWGQRELLALAVLLAVAMLLMEAASLGALVQRAYELRPVKPQNSLRAYSPPLPFGQNSIMSSHLPTALGVCAVFWFVWAAACLAAGPRWRVTALVFAILTLTLHAAREGLLVWTAIEQWRGYSPGNFYYARSPFSVAWAGQLVPALVLTVFLSRGAVAAAFRDAR